MDATKNSKALLQQMQTFDKQEPYTSPYLLSYPSTSLFTPNYPMLTTMEFNVLKNARANTNRGNSNFFAPSEGYSDDVPRGEHSFEDYSHSDSSSEVGCDALSDEEVSLDELLLHDENAKKKIEKLAAMVGVDTTEPAVVLTEVVRVLKHLKRIDQYHTTT